MDRPTYCKKEDCVFLFPRPTEIAGREGGKYARFPGMCNHQDGPEMDLEGHCRYAETFNLRIEGGHEYRWKRCPECGATTVIGGSGQTCASEICNWSKK